jgi:PilZ domain
MAEMRSATPSEAGSDRRRSHRVNIAMPILVRGKKAGQSFEEETLTICVSAHGCMFRLKTQVTRPQDVSIVNTKTAEELPCKVTFLGQKEAGKAEVGVEFVEPSPLFWRIAFPPENWDPSERKRPGGSLQSPIPKAR